MSRPKLNNIRVVFYAPKDFNDEIRAEARRRKISLGNLVIEAFKSRMMIIKK